MARSRTAPPDPAFAEERVDRVAGDPATSEWKRRARAAQSRWREARAHPIGAEPYAGGAGSRPLGSRLALAHARESGANFLTEGARAAARERLATPERYQTLRADRLHADLLSSMPLCFNLFGDLSRDPGAAARALRAFFPDAPSGAVTVRFEHSPGRRDPAFLGNQSAFDVAFDVDLGGGKRAIVGVETKYHEHLKAEAAPEPARLARYVAVTEASGLFVAGWRDALVGTELQQLWLDHLLALSMLQHPSGAWRWARFVLVHPAQNPSFARGARRYAALLRDASTFEARTIESLLREDVLGAGLVDALRARYLLDA